jgi:hypothetical protein
VRMVGVEECRGEMEVESKGTRPKRPKTLLVWVYEDARTKQFERIFLVGKRAERPSRTPDLNPTEIDWI